MRKHIAFIGGGNMASAIISGMIKGGAKSSAIDVIEPLAETRDKLKQQFGISAQTQAGDFLARASMVVWAVKPQNFKEAALMARFHTKKALHLSVAAGIPSSSIAKWLDNERVIRTMPNTPALIGKGITGMFARAAVTSDDRALAEQAISTTGALLWFEKEEALDAVTALSGSGPAYMFYFMEAMTEAGAQMGLTRDQAYALASATFVGAGELARQSTEPPEILRQRVTSKGGTTHAAVTAMDASDIKTHFVQAMLAAQKRAQEMGREFGEA